jgi:hypothetical protein
MLPIPSRPASWDWLLAVDDADSFLERSGAGWRCSQMLDHWRQHYGCSSPANTGEADRPQAAPIAAAVLPQTLRERTKGSEWTPAEKEALRDAVHQAGPGGAAAAARELGISQARVSGLLASLGKDLTPGVWAAGTTRKRA